MEDNELIEQYLRGGLTSDEVIDFKKRLDTDNSFKDLFEIESVIFKSLQYSIEMERIKKFSSSPVENLSFESSEDRIAALDSSDSLVMNSPNHRNRKYKNWLKGNNLLYGGIAAIVVWIIPSVISGLLSIDPTLIKWLGLAFAFIFSAISIFTLERKINIQLITSSILNGVLIFVIASGLDAINQGIGSDKNDTKAILIPFTQKSVWWPTQSLVDSVVKQKEFNRELIQQKKELSTVLELTRDSCFLSRFDNYAVMVRPKSSIVASGSSYEADMFLVGSVSSFTPKMKMDGKLLELINDASGVKMGKVKFTATDGPYDPKTNLARKTFSAEIHIKDTIIKQDIEYFVAKPIIRVTTGNVPTLYMNCGNSVMIEVPALGSNYNPSFSSIGAKIIKGDKPGRVTIIPNQRKVSVTVSNDGTTLGTEPFDVKPIPDPIFLLTHTGRSIIQDQSRLATCNDNGVQASALESFRYEAVADEDFKEEAPKDAIYRIKEMRVTHGRGSSPINTITVFNENVDVSRWRAQFKPGDMIIIEIKRVVRVTFDGKEEPIEPRYSLSRIPLL